MRTTSGLLAFGLFLGAAGTAAADDVELKVVKMADLTKLIEQNKGKVIVLDFWASY